MATNEQRDEHKNDDGGIHLQAGDKRVHIGKDETKTILGYTGNAWRFVVYAIAYAVTIIATFFALSLNK